MLSPLDLRISERKTKVFHNICRITYIMYPCILRSRFQKSEIMLICKAIDSSGGLHFERSSMGDCPIFTVGCAVRGGNMGLYHYSVRAAEPEGLDRRCWAYEGHGGSPFFSRTIPNRKPDQSRPRQMVADMGWLRILWLVVSLLCSIALADYLF